MLSGVPTGTGDEMSAGESVDMRLHPLEVVRRYSAESLDRRRCSLERYLHEMVNFGANVQVRRERLHHYFVQRYTVAGGSYCCGPMKCWGNPNIEKSLERTLRLLSNLRTGLEVVINSCLKLVLKQVRRVGLVRDDIVNKQYSAAADSPRHVELSRSFVSVVLK